MSYSEDLKIAEAVVNTKSSFPNFRDLYIEFQKRFTPYYVIQLITSLRDVSKEAELLREQARRCEELDAKVGDMQRLCERALLIITESYDKFTDDEGYGPISLIRDLEKVADGKECRDLRALNDALANALSGKIAISEKLQQENTELNTLLQERDTQLHELKAYVEELRNFIIEKGKFTCYEDGMVVEKIHEEYAAIAFDKTPSQSLHDRDMAIAEAVREECGKVVDECWTYGIPYAECGKHVRSLDLSDVLEEIGGNE